MGIRALPTEVGPLGRKGRVGLVQAILGILTSLQLLHGLGEVLGVVGLEQVLLLLGLIQVRRRLLERGLLENYLDPGELGGLWLDGDSQEIVELARVALQVVVGVLLLHLEELVVGELVLEHVVLFEGVVVDERALFPSALLLLPKVAAELVGRVGALEHF